MSLKIRTSFNFLQKASHYRKKERKEKNSHQTPDTTTDGGMEETKPFLLRFKVKDYLNLPYEPGCSVYSERVRGKDRSVWQLQLYPGGATDDDDVISDENNVYMSVFLHTYLPKLHSYYEMHTVMPTIDQHLTMMLIPTLLVRNALVILISSDDRAL